VTVEFEGAFPGQLVKMTWDQERFLEPGSVLVFVYYQGRLLLTRHKRRGWELPGGTREDAELPVHTAIREVYEETGAVLEKIEPLGQYVIEAAGMPPLVKTIYIAKACGMHPLPSGFETAEVRLEEQAPSPEHVKGSAEYSILLKDDVYRYALERAKAHRFSSGREGELVDGTLAEMAGR